ncbi:Fur-regulated basic protein FbpA [Radiobacillus sp. PE A8.2]|uniref:Fur-regulated basic protein FbpA n=1 Tax=Radiobacillus sp. PE A8.2 TaxID=3380349 RepID=UPI00388FD9E6
MGHLRTAVERQRNLLIRRLIQSGATDYSDAELYNKTITELVEEYQKIQANDIEKENMEVG